MERRFFMMVMIKADMEPAIIKIIKNPRSIHHLPQNHKHL